MKIFNFLSRLNPAKMFDTIASGIDKSILTNQEKSEMSMAVYKAQLEHAKTQANASTISSRARRVLAFMVATPFLAGKTAAMYMSVWGDPANAVKLDSINNGLALYFGGVMTFYFGTYLYQKIAEKK